MKLNRRAGSVTQRGMTLFSLIGVLALLASMALVVLRVAPTLMEYFAIKKSMVYAKENGKTIGEIQNAFDRQTNIGYIESVNGKDLDIEKTDTGFDVSIAYTKTIPLAGAVSLVIDYAATTAVHKWPARKLD